MQAELVKGSTGAFEIVADGALIFSKHHEGRFPDLKEIIQALRK